ncbi:hypothetical protein [Nocardioides marmorisolisilvae]|uniref:hypothetical protein n=1 Tax=Nocardioides marmorisolisilvae TaxID=1542737 RepID=UPI0011CE344D|nr:hypothetical protein [Nocardioides marmorisolisilvae]
MAIRRALAVLTTALAISTLIIPAANADEWVQVGSRQPTTVVGWGVAIGTTITVDDVYSYNYTYKTDRFYWVGATFSNDYFFQVGFKDAGATSGCQGLEYFVAEIDDSNNLVQYVTQSCVPVGETHYFNMINTGTPYGDGRKYWQARVGTTNIGNAVPLPNSFPLRGANAVSEVSTVGTFGGGSPIIPRTSYDPAVRLMYLDGSWHDQASGLVYRATPGGGYFSQCPPYRVGSGTANALVTSQDPSITCKADGVALW